MRVIGWVLQGVMREETNVKTWRVPDIVDLEFFLAQDSRQDDSSAAGRDRRIYLLAVEPRISPETGSGREFRRRAIRIWLEERRKIHRKRQSRDALLPGETFAEARSVLALIVGLAGLLTGSGVAFSLLIYTGRDPVNVSVYLGVLVFLQILGLIMMARFLVLKTSMNVLRRYSLIYALLGGMLERMTDRLSRGAAGAVPGERRMSAGELSGTLKGMYGVYGRVLFWPVFSLVQLFGVLFNVGAIGATLIRVLTRDLAFGWQTTLQLGPEGVHTLVRVLALPWSWLLGETAYPRLEQIEGSRIVLKEGIASLSTGNLVSWWPFLVAAVAFYGLLPRLVLLAGAMIGGRRSLARLDFSHASCEELLVRMQSPTLSTQGLQPREGLSDLPRKAPDAQPPQLSGVRVEAAVLVSEDIYRRCNRPELESHLRSLLGWGFAYLFPLAGEFTADKASIDDAVDLHSADGGAVVLVQEAWQPPIVEIVRIISELRKRGGRDMRIAVLLIGKPESETIFTPVKAVDKDTWTKVLAMLGDPYLRVVAVGDR